MTSTFPRAEGYEAWRPTFFDRWQVFIGIAVLFLCAQGNSLGASHVTIDSNQVLVIDGQKVFPIGFTKPPPPEAKTPDGKNGIA